MPASKAKRSKPRPASVGLVDEIERVRSNNNTLWMDILRTALQHSPVITKAALRLINRNDKKISALLGKLAK